MPPWGCPRRGAHGLSRNARAAGHVVTGPRGEPLRLRSGEKRRAAATAVPILTPRVVGDFRPGFSFCVLRENRGRSHPPRRSPTRRFLPSAPTT